MFHVYMENDMSQFANIRHAINLSWGRLCAIIAAVAAVAAATRIYIYAENIIRMHTNGYKLNNNNSNNRRRRRKHSALGQQKPEKKKYVGKTRKTVII